MANPTETRKEFVLEALDRFECSLLKYATRLLNGDEASARDIVQHAFLKLCVVSKLPDNVAPWLYTVCRNKAMDRLRQKNREPAGEQAFEFTFGKELDPADQYERSTLLRLIQGLIAELSPSEREVAELWSQGFSNQKMSQIIGKTESAVRVSLHRAIKSLRQHPVVAGWIRDDASGKSSRPVPEPSRTIGQS